MIVLLLTGETAGKAAMRYLEDQFMAIRDRDFPVDVRAERRSDEVPWVLIVLQTQKPQARKPHKDFWKDHRMRMEQRYRKNPMA